MFTRFCLNSGESLPEVTLPEGLIEIRQEVFCGCKRLLEIVICNTVRSVGQHVVASGVLLAKVEFEEMRLSPRHHQLVAIGKEISLFS